MQVFCWKLVAISVFCTKWSLFLLQISFTFLISKNRKGSTLGEGLLILNALKNPVILKGSHNLVSEWTWFSEMCNNLYIAFSISINAAKWNPLDSDDLPSTILNEPLKIFKRIILCIKKSYNKIKFLSQKEFSWCAKWIGILYN